MTQATGPDHNRWHDTAAAYVLGALPPAEAEAYAAHLESCPACRAEVDDLRPAATALPAAAPQVAPPGELRERVMSVVRGEAALLAAAGERGDRVAGAPARRWFGGWRLAAVAAAALLIGVAVGLGVAGLGGGERILPVRASGPARAAGARLVIDDGRAVLRASGLPAPPSGRVYQVWLQPPGGDPRPTNALFTPRADGSATVGVPGDVEGSQAVMVTAEPRGGSPAPTSAPVLVARVS